MLCCTEVASADCASAAFPMRRTAAKARPKRRMQIRTMIFSFQDLRRVLQRASLLRIRRQGDQCVDVFQDEARIYAVKPIVVKRPGMIGRASPLSCPNTNHCKP